MYSLHLTLLETQRDSTADSEDQLDDPIYRVSGSGPNVGLDAIINIDPSAYMSYAKSYYGASILVHGTQVFPQAVDKITFAQPGCDVTVAVIPSVVVSEPAIRDLALEKRSCFFDDEVNTYSVFNSYSQK